MNVAVLVYGEMRQFDIAIETWKFLEDFDCDVYISTWNKSTQINDFLNIRIEENINEEYVKNIISPFSLQIYEEGKDYILTKDVHPACINSSKMLFHWKKLLNSLKEHDKNYDSILLIRNDLYITHYNKTNFISSNLPDRIYGQSHIQITGIERYFVPDTFFYGKQKFMIKFLEHLDDFTTLYIHNYLAAKILDLNLFVDKCDIFTPLVLRGNCFGLKNLDSNTIMEKLRLWDETKNIS